MLVGVGALFYYPITKQFNKDMQAQLSSRRKFRLQEAD